MNSTTRRIYLAGIFAVAIILLFSITFIPAYPQEEKAAEAAGMRVQRIVFCTSIVEREPVGEGKSFAADIKKVFCFTEVLDAGAETLITHEWYYKDELKATVRLKVAGERWRTWSSKGIDKNWTGEWRVEVKDEGGNLLTTASFTIGDEAEDENVTPEEKSNSTGN